MTPLFVLVSLGLIWANLVGLGLMLRKLAGDYAVARVGGVLALCLGLFCFEHFVGLGPGLWFYPLSTALSAWLIWRERATLRLDWGVEAAFGAGFLYCAAWRYFYPGIDLIGEKIPDLVLINDYITGAVLPAPDKWFPPLRVDFYYSFQYYAAALLGRWFWISNAGVCYQFAFCVISGLITCAAYAAARRLCAWRPASWAIVGAVLVGGSGLGLVTHLALTAYFDPIALVRYIGTEKEPETLTAFGKALEAQLSRPGEGMVELPVAPVSELIAEGEFHPPLTGFLILGFSLLLIAALEDKATERKGVLSAALGATVPLSLIGDTWVFPLQIALVAGWLGYRALVRERGHWAPFLYGLGGATALAFPFLSGFLQHPAATDSAVKLVPAAFHATPAAWLAVFWPLACLLILAPLNRERRGLTALFAGVLVVILAMTECLYISDTYAGTFVRFNSCLKWWGWAYAAGIIGLGSLNMASKSRICRYGSLLAILLPTAEAYDYGRQFFGAPPDQVGRLEGGYWLTRDSTNVAMVEVLREQPDGTCIDSGNTYENTDATVLAVFAGKASYVGWPTQENIWRGFRDEIRVRVQEEKDFYAGKMDDPLRWLLKNNIRYVLWLQKDNDNDNARFLPMDAKIRSHYVWRQFAGTGPTWCVGFWELADPPQA